MGKSTKESRKIQAMREQQLAAAAPARLANHRGGGGRRYVSDSEDESGSDSDSCSSSSSGASSRLGSNYSSRASSRDSSPERPQFKAAASAPSRGRLAAPAASASASAGKSYASAAAAGHAASLARQQQQQQMAAAAAAAVQQHQQQQQAAEAVNQPQGGRDWKEIDVLYFFEGSLNQLAQGEKKAVMCLRGQGTRIFDVYHNEVERMNAAGSSGNRSVGASQQQQNDLATTLSGGNAESVAKHAIGKIEVVRVHSTFPCALALNLEGVAVDNHNQFTDSGVRGHLIMMPEEKERMHHELLSNPGQPQKYLKHFRGWDSKNIHTRGVVEFPNKGAVRGEKSFLIEASHPVLAMYRAARHSAEQKAQELAAAANSQRQADKHLKEVSRKYPKLEFFRGWASMPESRMKPAMEMLQRTLVEKVRLVDASSLRLSISRAVTSPVENTVDSAATWNDTYEVVSADQNPKFAEAVLSKVNRLYVQLRIRYTQGDSE